LGPSLGSNFAWLSGSGAGPSSLESASSLAGSGKRVDNWELDGSLMTPRWISRDGRTLSENTGMFFVFGIGKGCGLREPKRIEMA
jgi:hypothetical protein